jgi:hypothetical protein
VNVDWFFTTQGRIARIVVGSLLIIIGLGIIGGFFGVILLLVGAVPIASAAYGTFLLAPFFGRDIRGNREGGAPVDEEPEDEEPEDEDEDEPERERSEPEASSDDADDHAGGDDKPNGARPVRAERPPGQGPRTKDLRTESPGGEEPE